MKLFLIALQFLTVLPIKIPSEIKAKDFGKSLVYFPVVGLLIGFLLIFIYYFFNYFSKEVSSVFILITSIIITGGLHLDGFADTCDGLYGSKTKERALEIMRDSHIGTMGVIGAILLLLLKFSLLLSFSQAHLWKFLLLAPTFARWTQILACFSSKYARQEGKAKYFVEYSGIKEIVIGIIFTLTVFILLMQLKGLILFIISAAGIFLFINSVKKKIGGMTGDTIGATNELAEVLLFLVGSLILKIKI